MIVRTRTSKEKEKALQMGRETLLGGGLVACPTESFYGLAVDAGNEGAIMRLLRLKKRSGGHPILLLIPSVDLLPEYVAGVPPVARALMERFWPGGLTLVFEASDRVSPLLTAGTGRIGLRLSGHPLATGLAGALGRPITGTSANLSGSPPCSSAEEVLEALGEGVDLIVDGGRTPGGTGSTILDVTAVPPVVLRRGMVQDRQLREFTEL